MCLQDDTVAKWLAFLCGVCMIRLSVRLSVGSSSNTV